MSNPAAIEELLNLLMPEGWRVTNVSDLDPGWQVIVTDDDYIVTATGDYITHAIAAAALKIKKGDFTKLVYRPLERADMERIVSGNLLDMLGLRKPKPLEKIRRI